MKSIAMTLREFTYPSDCGCGCEVGVTLGLDVGGLCLGNRESYCLEDCFL